ncbi:hypothetical protein FQR65_LT00879 [Abscondita terminalis]|nr:hypothetical protein FQR65_LT00879 [Abscondita terminalis]
MLIQIADVFTPHEAAEIRRRLDAAEWVDGKVTAGLQSAEVKRNRQLPELHPLAQELGKLILQRLSGNNLFMSARAAAQDLSAAVQPLRGRRGFGYHVDNAVRALSGGSERVRTDLSATLFFSEPDAYDGGELVIDDTYGPRAVKLPAGHMVLYPGTSLHKSLVREDSQRALLLDMDVAIQRLNQDAAGHPSIVQLTGIYHNLLRRWVDV